MQKTKVDFKISKLLQMWNKELLNFDLVIQRKDGIWDIERQGLLINSILNDYPIPPLYVKKEGRIHSFLDGKQRLTSIIEFLENKYALPNSIKKFNNIEIKGKKFNELPQEFQDIILNYKLTLECITEASEEDIKNIFFRLNNGVALKTIETTRAVLGTKILKFIEGVTNTPFFSTKINIPKSSRKRYVDQELVLQTVMLIHKANTGFSSKELYNFSKTLTDDSLRTELTAKMQNGCYFLNEAYLVKEKFLKKITIPMIFYLAYAIQHNKLAITPGEFYEWSCEFFKNVPEEYRIASISGSSKKENVQKRLSILSENFKEYFKDKIVSENLINSEIAVSDNTPTKLND